MLYLINKAVAVHVNICVLWISVKKSTEFTKQLDIAYIGIHNNSNKQL